MIDTHCHIHDRKYDADREAVVERARAAGVSAMLTVGEDLADSARAISTAQRYGIAAAAGIHPHEARNAPAELAPLRALLEDPRVIAVGEMGLDYYYDHSPRDAQARVLRAQLAVARDAGLPVVFHLRDAFDDFVAILREEWAGTMRGVVHCFTGTAEQALIYTGEFGLLLGIGGVVTFPNAEPVREAVCAAGIGSVVLETDCPYLAPVPMRGKRNEPAFLQYTAARVAALLGMSPAEVSTRTDANARRLFGFK